MFKSTLLYTTLSALAFAQPPVPERNQVRNRIQPPKPQAAAARPLVFEPNRGQADPEAKWIARGPGYHLFLDNSGATMVHHGSKSKVKMKLQAGHPLANMNGVEPTGGVSNYLLGSDSSKWHTGIPHYERVRAGEVYDGIDLVFYGQEGQLEYDFVVKPGADPKQIRVAFDGIERMRLDEKSGELVLTASSGHELRQGRPKVYQEFNGKKVEIMASYQILDRRQAAFQLAGYDRRQPLVIDPTLNFERTALGENSDLGSAMAVRGGDLYITGTTNSVSFSLAAAFQLAKRAQDAFIQKYSSTGRLMYSTYLGGNDRDGANAIAVDATGIYVAGETSSLDLPGAAGPAYGADAFVTKLNPSGSAIIYSRLIGGSARDVANGIALTADGSVYVACTTNSNLFPLVGRFQPYVVGRELAGGALMSDALVARLSPAGVMQYFTYLGGSDIDEATGITIDPQGYVTVVGNTRSPNFPTRGAPPMLHVQDAFVTRFSPALDSVVFSAYLGSSGWDSATAVTSDQYGFLYLTGLTNGNDFRTTPGSLQPNKPGGGNISGWVAKLNGGGYIYFATYLGGVEGEDYLNAIGVAEDGTIALGGRVGSATGFPGNYGRPSMAGRGFAASMTNDGAYLNWAEPVGNEVWGVVMKSPAPNTTYVLADIFPNRWDLRNYDVMVARYTDLPGSH